MHIVDERPSTDVIMDFELTEGEHEVLLKYAKDHMPEEDLDRCMIEWAILDAIKTTIALKEDKDEDTSS